MNGEAQIAPDDIPGLLRITAMLERAAEVAGVSREERVAARLAASMAVRVGKALKPEEMVDLVDRLFGCSTPALDPFGRTVIVNFESNELEQRFR